MTGLQPNSERLVVRSERDRGAIQLSIMLGAALGGLLLDHISVASTFISGALIDSRDGTY
jgi:predicted MFS family arabinose efflux permease